MRFRDPHSPSSGKPWKLLSHSLGGRLTLLTVLMSISISIATSLIGYSVFEPASGDVTQIAVDKQYRRKGIGSLLFNKMLEVKKQDSLKIVNTEINCDSITSFLKSKNIEPTGKQYEMIKTL